MSGILRMKIINNAIFVLLLIALTACSSNEDRPEDMTEQELYGLAQQQLKDESFRQAVRTLQLLETRYPFGPYAEQAQLEIIYAHYRSYDQEAAVAAADRFIRLHPQHANIDYAFYIKGLANYEQGDNFFSRFVLTDQTKRDPGAALRSFEDFKALLYRFPDSPYARDASARMKYLRARLARYELNVANYYFKRGAYMAAANRGRYVVENFPKAPATGDALAVMVQAYQLLNLDDLAADSLAVLQTNYPNHPSLDENGNFIDRFTVAAEERSLVNKVSFGLIDRAEPPKFDNRAEFLKR